MKLQLKLIKMEVLLMLLLAAAGIVKAQTCEFAPVGAEWHYGINQYPTEGYLEIRSISDTVIDDIPCRKIEKHCLLYDHLDDVEIDFIKGYEYVTQIGDSVLLFRYGKFYKLYDFASEIGDTLNVPGSYSITPDEFVIYGDSIGKAVVVGKGVLEVEGRELRYVDLQKVEGTPWAFVQDYYLGYARICEIIGNLSGYLFPEQMMIADYFEGGLLRCYSDESIGTINLSSPYVECEYYHSVGEKTHELLSIYPNPFKDRIIVELPIEDNYFLEIYDTFGRMIIKQDFKGKRIEQDFLNHQSGLYYLVIHSESNYYVTNIVKL